MLLQPMKPSWIQRRQPSLFAKAHVDARQKPVIASAPFLANDSVSAIEPAFELLVEADRNSAFEIKYDRPENPIDTSQT